MPRHNRKPGRSTRSTDDRVAVIALVHRKARKPGVKGLRPIRAGAMVKARCWCDRSAVFIPIEFVSRGVTASCGRRGCEAS
jgi:hypothetical protein